MNMSPKEYNRYVARLAKKSPLGKDLLRSFLVGGLICVIGQLILHGFTALDLSAQDAAAATSAALRREIALKKLTKAQKETLCAGWMAEKE